MSLPVLDKLPYTLENLPYGIISTASEPIPRCAVAIGDHAIDLSRYARTGRFSSFKSEKNLSFEQIFSQPHLNPFASLPSPIRRAIRAQLQLDLRTESIPGTCLVPLSEVLPHLPMSIGGFTDFYTSLEHCKNCSGEMTTSQIPSNWFLAPSAYNSRVSSVLPSPASIPRPVNVSFASSKLDTFPAVYAPSRKLDFELEMGFYVSKPVPFGETLPMKDVKEHIFGFVLLNDWSARDHQLFEMRPLGPFHSKGFGTGTSNWIVPIEALEGFACEPGSVTAEGGLPEGVREGGGGGGRKVFEHLAWPAGEEKEKKEKEGGGGGDGGALDVRLRVKLVRDGTETVLATSNLKYLYWTPYQQLVHHAASGCGMETGDLIGTGTISGSGTDDAGRMIELGCLYEAQQTGTKSMPETGVSGKYDAGYIEDGDEIVLEGWCEDAQGKVVLGFGECRGRITPPKRNN